MKNNLHIQTAIHFPKLEKEIQEKNAILQDLARRNAKHHATNNCPSDKDETMAPLTEDLKTGYEHLGAVAFKELQASAHFQEAEIEAEGFREQDKTLEVEVLDLENQNKNDRYELQNYNPGTIPFRLRVVAFFTFCIFSGEVLFNTESFQVIGENMLFALLISFSISLSVMLFSHFASFLLKEAKTALQRRLIVFGSLGIITLVFIALAFLRSAYLESHDVQISPTYFVGFNLFMFIVSSLLSIFVLPTRQEIKENTKHLALYRKIIKRQKQIIMLNEKRKEIRKIIEERTKARIRLAHYANDTADIIRKMYWQAVAIFKSTNLTFRTDRLIPSCFNEVLPEPAIPDFELVFKSSNNKQK